MAQGAASPPAFVRSREETFKMTIAADAAKTDRPVSSRDSLHQDSTPCASTPGMTPTATKPRTVSVMPPAASPLHCTAPYQVRSASSPRN